MLELAFFDIELIVCNRNLMCGKWFFKKSHMSLRRATNQCEKIQSVRLAWLCLLACIFEGAHSIKKYICQTFYYMSHMLIQRVLWGLWLIIKYFNKVILLTKISGVQYTFLWNIYLLILLTYCCAIFWITHLHNLWVTSYRVKKPWVSFFYFIEGHW